MTVQATRDFTKSVTPKPGLGWVVRVKAGGQEFAYLSYEHDRGATGEVAEQRIEFRYEWDTTPNVNFGLIRIFNRSNPIIFEAFEKGEPVKLEISWQGDLQDSTLVVNGTIVNVDEYWESNNARGVEVLFGDANELLNTKITSRTWKPGVTYSNVFLTHNKDLGLVLKKFKPKVDGEYRTGMAAFGLIWPQMQMVARDMQSKLYCYNREVYLLPWEEGIETQVVWTQLTGLLRLQKGIKLTADGRYKIRFREYEPVTVRFRHLFDINIGPDRIFEVKPEGGEAPPSMEVGKWRTVRGVHYNDDKVLYTEVDAIKVR